MITKVCPKIYKMCDTWIMKLCEIYSALTEESNDKFTKIFMWKINDSEIELTGCSTVGHERIYLDDFDITAVWTDWQILTIELTYKQTVGKKLV